MSVCDHNLISRGVLADVSGHGRDVNAVTQTLRKNINAWDQSDFKRELNDTFSQGGNDKYATAIVLSFHRVTGRLAFCNAGQLPPLWYHAAQRAWGWLEEGTDSQAKKVSGLPVGLIPWERLSSDGCDSKAGRSSRALYRWHHRRRERECSGSGTSTTSGMGAPSSSGLSESVGRRLASAAGVVSSWIPQRRRNTTGVARRRRISSFHVGRGREQQYIRPATEET